MTSTEIDRKVEKLKLLQRTDPATAAMLCEEIVSEAGAIGYERPLPYAHVVHANIIRMQSKLDAAASEFETAIEIAQKTDDREIEGRALSGRGTVEERRDNYPLAKTYYDRAFAIAQEINDAVGAGLAQSDLAWVHQHWGLHELASKHARASLEALRATDEAHVALHRMGTLLADSGHYSSALEFFEQAISAARNSQDQIALALNYAWSASMHLHLGDARVAKEINLKAVGLSDAMNDRINVANLTAKIGYCEMELGNFADAEERMRSACQLFLAEGMADHPRFSNLASCLMSLADLEIRRGRAQEALTVLASAAKYLEASGSKRHEWRLHETYAKAYEAMENWQMVVHHDHERQRLRQERDSEQFRDKLNAAQMLIATERERHEKETERLRAEQLQRDLANNAIHLVAQTELLDRFRTDVDQIFHEIDEPIATLKKIKEKLKALPNSHLDWSKFEAQFSMVHPAFKSRIEEMYPDLTNQEVRMCSLVRAGLRNPEIAKLLSLSERTLENHRFNIRKKLFLKTEQSLHEFLSTYI